MKTLITLLFCLLAQPAFSADSMPAKPGVPDMPAMPAERPAADAPSKTLLSKPAGDACKADREKFCKEVKPGKGAIIRCLKDHKDELSADCIAKGEWMKEQFKERRQEINEACTPELEKFCKGKEGPRQRMGCLKQHSDHLSDTCRASMPVKP